MRKFVLLTLACLAAVAASTYASDARVDNVVDPYGNMFLQFVAPSATCVNNCVLKNAATGNNPSILVVGTDTNISLALQGKGTGGVSLLDGSGNALLTTVKTASSVNNVQLTNAATAGSPDVAAVGTDSNISLTLTPKGTGSVQAQLGGATANYGGVVVQASRQFSAAGVGNAADATDDTLFTYTLPAGALKNTGDWVRISCWGKCAATTHNCTAKIFFGSTTAVTSGTVSTTSIFPIYERCTIIKTGASTQLVCTEMITFGAGTSNIAPAVPTAASETDTNAIVIKMTGSSASSAANDVLGQGFLVELGHQ